MYLLGERLEVFFKLPLAKDQCSLGGPAVLDLVNESLVGVFENLVRLDYLLMCLETLDLDGLFIDSLFQLHDDFEQFFVFDLGVLHCILFALDWEVLVDLFFFYLGSGMPRVFHVDLGHENHPIFVDWQPLDDDLFELGLGFDPPDLE